MCQAFKAHWNILFLFFAACYFTLNRKILSKSAIQCIGYPNQPRFGPAENAWIFPMIKWNVETQLGKEATFESCLLRYLEQKIVKAKNQKHVKTFPISHTHCKNVYRWDQIWIIPFLWGKFWCDFCDDRFLFFEDRFYLRNGKRGFTVNILFLANNVILLQQNILRYSRCSTWYEKVEANEDGIYTSGARFNKLLIANLLLFVTLGLNILRFLLLKAFFEASIVKRWCYLQ